MKQLPTGWRRAIIGDVFDVQQGKAVNVKAREGTNVQPFLRTANVFWNRFNLVTVDQMHFSEAEAKKLRLKRDDILVCEGGDIGRTAIWKSEIEPCFYQNHLHRLRPKAREEVDPYFFSLWMQTAILLRGLYTSQGNKTTIPNLSGARLKAFEFPLPPYNDQRAIADILRSVQDTRDARSHELQLELEHKAALIPHLFAHGTRGEILVETPLGKLPHSWAMMKLGEVCERPTYGYTDSASDEEVGPKFLRITDIQDGKVNWATVPYCKAPKNEPRLEPGDIVIARIGATTGKAFLVQTCPEAVFASYLIRVRSKPMLNADFLSYFLQTPKYWQQIDANKGDRLKGGVNIPILQDLPLPLPPLEEQREIAATLRACDDKIAALEEEATRLEELFRAMLEELMSGRLRVPEGIEQIEHN